LLKCKESKKIYMFLSKSKFLSFTIYFTIFISFFQHCLFFIFIKGEMGYS